MEPTGGLPGVNSIGFDAPFRWLGGAWRDMGQALAPCLVYGAVLAAVSLWFSWSVYTYNAAFWVLALTCGFVFVAPMLAMGLYEAGRQVEQGRKPTLGQVLVVTRAMRQDTAYLGLVLLLIYFFWGRIAQVVYGLSTWQAHKTIADLLNFALFTPDGHTMLIVGTAVGGVIAFLTYAMVVVSAPMLLDQRSNVFAATATSVRAVSKNFWPLTLWAVLIVVLLLVAAGTAFVGLVVIFPWLGLASWRAYRELVADTPAA